MWHEITQYGLQWNFQTGSVWLRYQKPNEQNITEKEIPVGDVRELDAIGSILRNEKPAYYNEDTNRITTGWEPTGEGE